jgi:hypothetical protein
LLGLERGQRAVMAAALRDTVERHVRPAHPGRNEVPDLLNEPLHGLPLGFFVMRR